MNLFQHPKNIMERINAKCVRRTAGFPIPFRDNRECKIDVIFFAADANVKLPQTANVKDGE